MSRYAISAFPHPSFILIRALCWRRRRRRSLKSKGHEFSIYPITLPRSQSMYILLFVALSPCLLMLVLFYPFTGLVSGEFVNDPLLGEAVKAMEVHPASSITEPG